MPVLIEPHVDHRRKANRPSGARAKELTGILTAARLFRFRGPVRVSERRKNGRWIHQCTLLGIYADGQTREESWQAFVEIFECDWDSVASEKDSRLTEGARALKRKYLELVEGVEPVL